MSFPVKINALLAIINLILLVHNINFTETIYHSRSNDFSG